MRVLITGANGFIAKNLIIRLRCFPEIEIETFCHRDDLSELTEKSISSDAIIHLAGVNRPNEVEEFYTGNVNLTETMVNVLIHAGKVVPVIYSSSIQAELNNPYGRSKLAAEVILQNYSKKTGAPVHVYRLPNVFGKWCRPNYNSVVATFCHNVAHGLSLNIFNPNASLRLVYIDDVVEAFIHQLMRSDENNENSWPVIKNEYTTTVGEIAECILNFKNSRETLVTEDVGSGFFRALYATYLSYLPTDLFQYSLVRHSDSRGVFVEMLKTRNSGQFSFFTARPGITRGGHYHHTKNEKFLIVQGVGRFCFRSLISDERFELVVDASESNVIETIPGWVHDVTNIGNDDLIVLLWANEIFDEQHPDTFSSEV